MTDPWLIQNNKLSELQNGEVHATENQDITEPSRETQETDKDELQFEDNFAPRQITASSGQGDTCHQALPDSESYLQGLERKLQKLKKSTKLVEALAEKRQDCLRSFLEADSGLTSCGNNSSSNNNYEVLALDTPITNGDSTVHDIYRLLQPVQAVTVGETVHIVNYDQLEQQRRETDEDDDRDETPASR